MKSVAEFVSKVFKTEKKEGNKEPQATSPNLDIVADVGYAMIPQPPPPPPPQPQLNAH